MFPQCFPVLSYGQNCFQRQFLFPRNKVCFCHTVETFCVSARHWTIGNICSATFGLVRGRVLRRQFAYNCPKRPPLVSSSQPQSARPCISLFLFLFIHRATITAITTLTSTSAMLRSSSVQEKCCRPVPSQLPKVRANLKVRIHPRCFQKHVSSFSHFGELHIFSCFLPVLPPGRHLWKHVSSLCQAFKELTVLPR